MSGMYNMKDLLNQLSQQNAEELLLEPGRPPRIVLHGKVRLLDNSLVTSDQVSELLGSIASQEQRRELELCGEIRFRCAGEHMGEFAVTAGMQGDGLRVKIKNLAR